MRCPKHPNSLMIPIYSGGLDSECLLDRLVCDECEMEKPPKPFRLVMQFFPEPKESATLVEEAVRAIAEAAAQKMLSGEHADAKEAILEATREYKCPKIQ